MFILQQVLNFLLQRQLSLMDCYHVFASIVLPSKSSSKLTSDDVASALKTALNQQGKQGLDFTPYVPPHVTKTTGGGAPPKVGAMAGGFTSGPKLAVDGDAGVATGKFVPPPPEASETGASQSGAPGFNMDGTYSTLSEVSGGDGSIVLGDPLLLADLRSVPADLPQNGISTGELDPIAWREPNNELASSFRRIANTLSLKAKDFPVFLEDFEDPENWLGMPDNSNMLELTCVVIEYSHLLGDHPRRLYDFINKI
jgi:hypothetical protein